MKYKQTLLDKLMLWLSKVIKRHIVIGRTIWEYDEMDTYEN